MGRWFGFILGFLCLACPGLPLMGGRAAAADLPAVTGLRIAEHDGITRFVLDLSGPILFNVTAQSDPALVQVDLPDIDWRVGAKGPARSVGLVRSYRYSPGRVMLDTGRPVAVKKAFLIPPGETANYRLVLDLAPATLPSAAAAAPVPRPSPLPSAAPQPAMSSVTAPVGPPVEVAPLGAAPAHSPPSSQAQTVAVSPLAIKAASVLASVDGVLKHAEGDPVARGPVPAPQPRSPAAPAVPPPAAAPPLVPAALPGPPPTDQPARAGRKNRGKPVVVIDPGHGGVDPGATSLSGAYEKNIVLALARDVKTQLDKGGKVQCLLTRERDVFIALRERVGIARSANADLFMSLHADTVADPEIRGLSVYTLSRTASDAEAQALADKENKADIVAGLDLSNESPEVTNILIDLVQRESMNHSAVFANYVIQEVSRETHQLLQNTHRFAGFAVLKAPDVPSVLVETGYLSNERDEQMLRRPEYRAKLATALARAIERYFAPAPKARRS